MSKKYVVKTMGVADLPNMTPEQIAAWINQAKTPDDRRMRKTLAFPFLYGFNKRKER